MNIFSVSSVLYEWIIYNVKRISIYEQKVSYQLKTKDVSFWYTASKL